MEVPKCAHCKVPLGESKHYVFMYHVYVCSPVCHNFYVKERQKQEAIADEEFKVTTFGKLPE